MATDPIVLERTQELTWALLDETITDDELSLLDNLLLSDDAARKCYVECVQVHGELLEHFRPARQATRGGHPVLPLDHSTGYDPLTARDTVS